MADALRVGFAGTPRFAATALAAIVDAGHDVALVLTRPDRPQGRGLRLAPSAVKELALERRLAVLQPPALTGPIAAAMKAEIDILVVAAYGLILPPAVLEWPRHGAVNIHASLLPRWRGAAPIQRALLAGDAETGVCIMQMDAGLDTGPVIDRIPIPIGSRDTAGMLTGTLAQAGADAIVKTLATLQATGALHAKAQDAAGTTYARKIERGEAGIRWNQDAEAIDRVVRAFNPDPGAFATLNGAAIKLWAADPDAATSGAPGTILGADADALVVACGRGALRIRELQRPGGRRLRAAEFLAGHPIAPGTAFDA